MLSYGKASRSCCANPQTTRMPGNVDMKNTPTIMSDHKEAIKNTEPLGRDCEEVHGSNGGFGASLTSRNAFL